MLKVLLPLSTALHRACRHLPQPGSNNTNTDQLHLYPQNSNFDLSLQKTTLNVNLCQQSIKGLPAVNYGSNRKRTAAGSSLRNMFKISAVDLQMTANTWGKV